MLLAVCLLFVGLALSSGKKSNGTTQEGVDASVKTAIWVVLAVVAFAYAVGMA